jgi:hypothetical protein
MNPFFAYFDPGSGSLLLQALVGGTAGLMVFGRYIWDAIRGYLGCIKPQPEASKS